MSSRKASAIIAPEDAGWRLDHWLAGRFTYHSRSKWQALVRDGYLRVNGQDAKPSYLLQGGDEVEYVLPKVDEPPVDSDFEIVWQDETMAAINKPGNLPCHPGGKYFEHTLWFLLKKRFDEFWMINRLDRETSGIVLIAFSSEAAAHLNRQFAGHAIRKEYWMLVEGSFPESITAKGAMGPDPNSEVQKKSRFMADSQDGEHAATTFEPLAERHSLSLIRCLPATGRLHQLRATALAMGYPVVGDKLYGVEDRFFLQFVRDELTREDWQRLRMPRQALHARSLQIRHPQSEQEVQITAPLPQDFKGMLLTHGFPAQYS